MIVKESSTANGICCSGWGGKMYLVPGHELVFLKCLLYD